MPRVNDFRVFLEVLHRESPLMVSDHCPEIAQRPTDEITSVDGYTYCRVDGRPALRDHPGLTRLPSPGSPKPSTGAGNADCELRGLCSFEYTDKLERRKSAHGRLDYDFRASAGTGVPIRNPRFLPDMAEANRIHRYTL